jgi:uncharacterized iron-regulated membrane protein
MPDGAYNVAAAILAGIVVRWLWARDRRQAEAVRMGTAPARSSSTPSWRFWALCVVALAVYTVAYQFTR